jgi:hypothetical protein
MFEEGKISGLSITVRLFQRSLHVALRRLERMKIVHKDHEEAQRVSSAVILRALKPFMDGFSEEE